MNGKKTLGWVLIAIILCIIEYYAYLDGQGYVILPVLLMFIFSIYLIGSEK